MPMVNLTSVRKKYTIHSKNCVKEFFMIRERFSKIMLISAVAVIVPFYSVFATTGKVNGNAVRLRKEPSTDSKIITLLEKGKDVEIISKENGWYNVKTGSNTGWISESLLIVNEEIGEASSQATVSNDSLSILAVTGSKVNLREGPTTKTPIVGKVVEGDNLISYGKTEDGLWYKVKFGDTEGYIYVDYVSTDTNKILGEGTINDRVNFRSEPSTSAPVLSKLSENSKITITGSEGEWYKVVVDGQEGWVVARCVDRVTATSRSGSNSTAQKVIELAKSQLGKKYVWGGNGPSSFDCSGLTKYVFGKVGVTLERVSANQATQGIAVSKANLQPGDLVFFSGINAKSSSAKVSHVGIYIGNGKFIHAANSSRGVVTDELSDSYYSSHYVTARRVIR